VICDFQLIDIYLIAANILSSDGDRFIHLRPITGLLRVHSTPFHKPREGDWCFLSVVGFFELTFSDQLDIAQHIHVDRTGIDAGCLARSLFTLIDHRLFGTA